MLKPPAYAPNAKPTTRGWIDHKTGELLVSRKHSEREVEEYFIAKANLLAPKAETIIEANPEPEPEAELLTEADPVVEDIVYVNVDLSRKPNFSNMTKAEIVQWAKNINLSLDMSMTKNEMIQVIGE